MLAGALLLVDLLTACIESSGRPSRLMRSLDRCEQLSVDRFDRVAIDGLNGSLHLRLVYLLEHVERRVRYLGACGALASRSLCRRLRARISRRLLSRRRLLVDAILRKAVV